uniref:Uncharacterized protein n=1 Tax=Moniliophthora roreri TaxID=221103 RepID=A0A0W0F361_MONRR
MPNNYFSALSIQTYRDTRAIFDYLTRTVSTLSIIGGIYNACKFYSKEVANQKAVSILTTLAGTIYHKHSQKIIARLPARVRNRLYYYLKRVKVGSDAMRESLVVMKDGSVQFTFTPMDIQHAADMKLQYSVPNRSDLRASWITQAHSMFSQLQIHEDKWDEYYMYYGFYLRFKCKRQHSRPQEKTEFTSSGASVYLFIRPVPQLSDNEEIWRSWAEATKYFWSLDSSGKEEMSEAMQVSLGLPSFTSTMCVYYSRHHQSAYKAIKMVHDYHHFDAATTALACSVGFPILEVVGGDDHFEVLDELECIWKKMRQKM